MKILFPKKSREIILDKISKNQAPKDFFYGSISYNDFDIHKQVVDTRPKIENFSIGYVRKLLNRILNNCIHFFLSSGPKKKIWSKLFKLSVKKNFLFRKIF